MVWGMAMPSGFGEFWPDGDFEALDDSNSLDWYDRLKLYYNEQMPSEQKVLFDDGDYGVRNYSSYVVDKFRSGVGVITGPGRPPFTQIEMHESPRSFESVKTIKSLGSLIKLNDSILAVDEDLKSLIERLEPNVHQFFPIEIRMPKGRNSHKSYFVLVIGQYFDSFSPENSDEGSWQELEWNPYRYTYKKTKKGMAGLAFSKAVFGSAHFWREKRFREELTCLSDELQAEIARAGLIIPKHHQMMEV